MENMIGKIIKDNYGMIGEIIDFDGENYRVLFNGLESNGCEDIPVDEKFEVLKFRSFINRIK